MSRRNRSHGKISDLPLEVKQEVENKLFVGDTYKEIEGYLRDLGHDISYSSVGRYGRDYLQKFENVRMAKDFAKLLAEDNVDRPTTEIHEANNALLSQMLMELFIKDSMSDKEKLKAASSIAALQQAQVRNEKLKIDARKASGELRTAMNLLKIKVFETIGNNHPDIAEAIMKIADEVENNNEILL